MHTIQEIKSAVQVLPRQEYVHFLNWIYDKDWSEWDNQLKTDINTGKLDFLINEATLEKKSKALWGENRCQAILKPL
ncbi:hypothetical protein SPONN_1709 [uncultured Candidatus Thioglobus sp.]|nr:hypothetical protein SPONN_1709 [uncultured Candidatus Thioglobus sp.]